ncbi:MAG TPA: hypothetical protein VI248_16210 [Kineosporiaceae bacterium]
MTLLHDVPHPDVTMPPSAPAAASRRRLAALGRRAVTVVGGGLVMVVCSALAVGVVSVSPQGFGFRLPELATSGALAGSDGLSPGAPAEQVPITVRNPGTTSLDILAVRPDLAALPAACPAPAWRTSPPPDLPTVAARAEATLTLPVALVPDAPASCQALTVRIPVRIDAQQQPTPAQPDSGRAGTPAPAPAADVGSPRPVTVDAQAEVTIATLGTPSATVGVRDGRVAVTPVRPASGPAPAGYTVSVLDDAGRRTVLCPRPVTVCVDPLGTAATPRRYLVTALLGTRWSRDSTLLTPWAPGPPPVPAATPAGAAAGGPVGTPAGTPSPDRFRAPPPPPPPGDPADPADPASGATSASPSDAARRRAVATDRRRTATTRPARRGSRRRAAPVAVPVAEEPPAPPRPDRGTASPAGAPPEPTIPIGNGGSPGGAAGGSGSVQPVDPATAVR